MSAILFMSECVFSLRRSDAYIHHIFIIGSDDGLLPIWWQAIIWTKPWFNVDWSLKNFNWNSNILIQDIAFQNAVYKMAAILSRPEMC